MKYLYLSIAIVTEVIATNALNASQGFTKLVPSAIAILGYGFSFYFLSISLKILPVGIVYASWAGLGIVLTSLLAAFLFKQIPDTPAIIGMTLIIVGVMIMNLYSKNASY